MKKLMKPIHLFVPITRIDDDERIVEGYAFVNEVVEGEGGIRLKRSAMEAATPDYLKNGTVRAMHQPIAAGKPMEVHWDEKGAMVRSKIVDDQEWRKVKEGVYKGYSIGVKATVMRGKDVEVCSWWDSSLVDIGKDKDALFSVWRSEDPEEESEVEVLDEERSDAPALTFPAEWTEEQAAEFKAQWERMLAGDTPGTPPAPAIKRFDELDGATEFIARITAVEGDLAKVSALETQLQQAIERIEAVEKRAVPIRPPVRYPEALERTFTQRDGENGNTGTIEELRAEYQALETSLKSEPDEQKRTEGVQRMIGIKNEITRLARLSQ